jgi:uncharacterized repeat protein (TIGR03803 family)
LVLSGNQLYGTAKYGGANYSGTVFAINTDGSNFTEIYQFTADSEFNTDGAAPQGVLIYSNNIFYGSADGGGEDSEGTVFSLVPTATAAAPVLSIKLSGTNDMVYWPVSSGYVLQSATSLTLNNWATVPSGSITNGGIIYYTNSTTTTNAAFFRLFQ